MESSVPCEMCSVFSCDIGVQSCIEHSLALAITLLERNKLGQPEHQPHTLVWGDSSAFAL
jgi:hypothetical protein